LPVRGAEIVTGSGYAPRRRAGNSRHLDQAFNAIDAQKEAGHAVVKSQNPAWRGVSGQEKGPGDDPSPSIWWRWRESNPRPTTFRRSLYMRSQSLFFIESSRTGTDRFRLFTWGFSVLASDLPLSRVDESRRLSQGHQHHLVNRSPDLGGEGVVSVVRN
jgi:hypothetical protein